MSERHGPLLCIFDHAVMMDTVAARRSQIDKAGFGLSMTHGTSMRPLIWGGRHCVAVAPLDGELQVGDLLMFVQHRDGREMSIVHRLVGINRQGGSTLYITRGDNCLGSETVSPEEVIGRVVEIHRMGGYRPWYAVASEKFTVTTPAYLRYVRLWMALWPVRRVCYSIRARYWAIRVKLSALFKKDR